MSREAIEITCSVDRDGSIEYICIPCICSPVDVKRIGDTLLFRQEFPEPTPYSIEYRVPVEYRVVCNGEFYREHVWGNTRTVYWSVEKPVKKLECIMGIYNILSIGDEFIIAYRREDMVKDIELDLFTEKLLLWRLLSKNRVYDKYVILSLGIDYGVLEPPLTYNNIESFIKSLVYSTLNIASTSIPEEIIDALIESIKGREPLIPLDIIPRVIESIVENRELADITRCFNVEESSGEIRVYNSCPQEIVFILKTRDKWLIECIGSGSREVFRIGSSGSYKYIALPISCWSR